MTLMYLHVIPKVRVGSTLWVINLWRGGPQQSNKNSFQIVRIYLTVVSVFYWFFLFYLLLFHENCRFVGIMLFQMWFSGDLTPEL